MKPHLSLSWMLKEETHVGVGTFCLHKLWHFIFDPRSVLAQSDSQLYSFKYTLGDWVWSYLPMFTTLLRSKLLLYRKASLSKDSFSSANFFFHESLYYRSWRRGAPLVPICPQLASSESAISNSSIVSLGRTSILKLTSSLYLGFDVNTHVWGPSYDLRISVFGYIPWCLYNSSHLGKLMCQAYPPSVPFGFMFVVQLLQCFLKLWVWLRPWLGLAYPMSLHTASPQLRWVFRDFTGTLASSTPLTVGFGNPCRRGGWGSTLGLFRDIWELNQPPRVHNSICSGRYTPYIVEHASRLTLAMAQLGHVTTPDTGGQWGAVN